MSLFKDSLKGGATRYIALAINFSLLVLVVRSLGAELRGEYVYLLGLSAVIAKFISFSVQSSIHNRRLSGDPLSSLLGFFVLLCLICAVVFAIAMLVNTYTHFASISFLVLLLLVTVITIADAFTVQLYVYNGLINAYNRSLVITAIVTFITTLLLLWWGMGLTGVFAGFIIGKLYFCCSFLYALSSENIDLSKPDCRPSTIIELLRNSLSLHVGMAGQVVIAQTSVIMLGASLNMAGASYYQLSLQLISLVYIFSQSVSFVFLSKNSSGKLAENWREQKGVIGLLLPLCILICTVLFFAAKLIPYVFGEEFEEAVAIFRVMLLVVPIVVFKNLIQNQILSRGYFKVFSFFTLLVAAISVLANYLLIPSLGVAGASYAYVIANSFYVVMLVYLVLRLNREVVDEV
ncbi:lipopolysaccharide biosynthesis protein [Agarivorans sp. Alg241-V36]|uniref:lipopolysaccharide biosynthesis protein n=1 Tax=Agarivorans sp. Alg241-V36 TaxID=2305992 RepID=UPI0013D17BCC|nr:hypothetical protein [Agarivorans sp. Alg241-V36]